MTDPPLLFVYGTLRPGGGASIDMPAGLHHIGAGYARGRLYRIDCYPGLVADPSGDLVAGDLFAIDDPAALAVIDAYEECRRDDPQPHEYVRAPLRIEGDGGPVLAWTYLYARDIAGLEPIAGGDFLGA